MISKRTLYERYGRTIQMTISVPLGLLRIIDDIAEKYSLSRSHTIACLLEYGRIHLLELIAKQVEDIHNKG